HTRGIKVVIDFVINHCSSRHPWFQAAIDPKSDKHDWFIWSDTRPAWNGPWGEVVWHPNPDKSQSNFYYGLFNHDMPDLNYRNPAVTAEIKETTKFWLTEMNVDGFRLDAIRHLIENGKVQENTPETHAWLRDFQAYCKSVKPDCFTVGEVWSDTRTIASYVNGQEMDSAFDFELSARLVEAIKTGKGQTLGDAIRNTCELFPRTVAGSSAAATFLTNHDQTRVMTLLGGDQMKAKAAASILLTMPGTPFIYYGEEIGMEGDKPDPNLRTPMQWTGEPGAGFTTGTPWRKPRSNPKVNVNSQEADRNSLLSHYRKMISIRRENDVLRHGDFTPMATSTPSLLMFRRSLAGQSVVVGVNLTNGVLAHDEIDREPQLRRLKKNGKHPLMVPSELLPGEAFVIGVDN
ncbi:MAG: hypothetical protein K2Q09_08855, partial [Phycisphaerales bacterium]|nr:hypothetical protein [Phycisphaerales bacterium]